MKAMRRARLCALTVVAAALLGCTFIPRELQPRDGRAFADAVDRLLTQLKTRAKTG